MQQSSITVRSISPIFFFLRWKETAQPWHPLQLEPEMKKIAVMVALSFSSVWITFFTSPSDHSGHLFSAKSSKSLYSLHLHQRCMQYILFFQQWTHLYPPRDDVALPPPVSLTPIRSCAPPIPAAINQTNQFTYANEPSDSKDAHLVFAFEWRKPQIFFFSSRLTLNTTTRKRTY